MVNWKKWFLEEDEEEIFEQEQKKRQENKKKEDVSDDDEFDIEFLELDEKKENTIKAEEIEYDSEESSDFDIDFEEEDLEESPKKDNNFVSKIKGLFSSNKSSKDEEFEEKIIEEELQDDDGEAEDYKTYLERQKRQNSTLEVEDEDEDKVEEKQSTGFFSKIKERLFSVNEEDIEKEELEADLDEFYNEQEEVILEEDTKEDDFEIVIEEKEEKIELEEIDLNDFEEKEEEEIKNTQETNLTDTLRKLGVENAEIKDVDIFGDKSERRTHPTLAAVRTKRLKQDHKIDSLGNDVILEKDSSDFKNEVSSAKVVSLDEEKYERRESKNEEEIRSLNSSFNKIERKEDKIEKDNPLYRKNDSKLDEIFDDITSKGNKTTEKEVEEFEVRESVSEAERREKLNYTSVNDILDGSDELFEDDIDRASKKTVGERFDEEEVASPELETFRKDVFEGKKVQDTGEKSALDELIEKENIDITSEKEGTLSEIEKLNDNLDKLKLENDVLEAHDEEQVEEIDLIEQVSKIEDPEIEEYDEIKEAKKDRLEGYSDYHLADDEIEQLEEQSHIEETADNIDIDSLLRDVSPNNKKLVQSNDVDKFIDEKVEPHEVAAKRAEKIAEEVQEEALIEVELEEDDALGIEYTEKLYTDDVYNYFDNEDGTKLGEYKTIDRGYRPVSKEKIENNQKILDAIFEKYSKSNISAPKKSVTTTIMETNTITPKSRNVGKFKPSPVYSSVYGSGPRAEVKSTKKPAGLSKGLTINDEEKPAPKKSTPKKEKVDSANIYKEIASQEETVWNIGSSKRVPKNKVKTKNTRK